MVEIVDIPIANLLFDEENPRLASPNQGQRETLRMLATNQGAKLRVLAQDILAHGLDPSELIIAMSVESSENRFVVLDGNRRLAALRALENPESVEGAIPKAVISALRRMSKEYPAAGLDSVSCVVVNDSEEARHWIELRHMGERGGAGSVLWGSEESARFRARTDPPEIHLQALDFLQSRGDITQEFRSKVALPHTGDCWRALQCDLGLALNGQIKSSESLQMKIPLLKLCCMLPTTSRADG